MDLSTKVIHVAETHPPLDMEQHGSTMLDLIDEKRNKTRAPVGTVHHHLHYPAQIRDPDSPHIYARGPHGEATTANMNRTAPRRTAPMRSSTPPGRQVASRPLSGSGRAVVTNNRYDTQCYDSSRTIGPGAPYGRTEAGHPLPHPDWARIHKAGAVPNQHGHVLLDHYTMKPTGAGLGYGRRHRTYFQYLSHYKQEIGPDDIKEAPDDNSFKPKGCDKRFPHALGYGTRHKEHYWYIATKSGQDL